MENKRFVYMNGRFVPDKDAKISIYDSALMFGDMVFEMTRSFRKRQFKLREHISRLYAGIKILRIPLEMTPEQMERYLAAVEASKASRERLRRMLRPRRPVGRHGQLT